MEATKNITVIPARRRVGNTVNKEVKPKLKVAAYCRVSTDSDEQANGLRRKGYGGVQIRHKRGRKKIKKYSLQLAPCRNAGCFLSKGVV